MAKKVAIIDHNIGGRLANQIWPYISAYAYCRERGYELVNYSFFQYARYFDLPTDGLGRSIDAVFAILRRITPATRYGTVLLRFRSLFTRLMNRISAGHTLIEAEDIPYVPPVVVYLPPSEKADPRFQSFDTGSEPNLYLKGWLFRNPTGIVQHGDEIRRVFAPKRVIRTAVETEIAALRLNHDRVIGVHIRQGDYKERFMGGKHYFSEKEVRPILDSFLSAYPIPGRTVFLICSDEVVDLSPFADLDVVLSQGKTPIHDLYLLSKTDTIICSDSTFAPLAAFFGNIPYIVFQRGQMDWEYYRDKKNYFENKYSTFVWF